MRTVEISMGDPKCHGILRSVPASLVDVPSGASPTPIN